MCVFAGHPPSAAAATKPSIYTQDPARLMGITKENLSSEISPEGKKRGRLCRVIKSCGA